ncbi:hypothetical protein L7F22_057042 [Adiantum nelumboides]|nr:hypothetical protein [Adiantum nelumboides]
MSIPTFNGAAGEDAQEFLDNLEIACLVTGRDDDATSYSSPNFNQPQQELDHFLVMLLDLYVEALLHWAGFAEAVNENVAAITLFVSLLCICVIIGHLLEEIKWLNDSIIALTLGCITGVVVLLNSRGTNSHILRFKKEVFFNYLLPPIIFNAGFQVKKKQFFRNFVPIILYGVVGVFVSFFIIAAGCRWLFPKHGLTTLSTKDYLALGAIFSAIDSVSVLQPYAQNLNMASRAGGNSGSGMPFLNAPTYDNLTPKGKPKDYKEGGQAVKFDIHGTHDKLKALLFQQQFDGAFANGNFTESSKIRKRQGMKRHFTGKTIDERKALRDAKKCFICEGHFANECPERNSQDKDDKSDRKGKKPKPSAGLVPYLVGDQQNMDAAELCRAWGIVRNQEVLVFFDSRARANFISPELASKLLFTVGSTFCLVLILLCKQITKPCVTS